MNRTVQIKLPPKLSKQVGIAAKRQRITSSQFVRASLQTSLFREELERARQVLVPAARRVGLNSDKAIFKAFS